MEPAEDQPDDAVGVLHAQRLEELAAMEPTAERPDGGAQPPTHILTDNTPQWSRPSNGRMTVICSP
jgi:hypothetical protein